MTLSNVHIHEGQQYWELTISNHNWPNEIHTKQDGSEAQPGHRKCNEVANEVYKIPLSLSHP